MISKKLIATIIILMFISISIISAFGVATPYHGKRPLTMARGETTIVELNLQNMVGDEDVNVKAELTSGFEIAKLKKDTFTVKAHTHDTIAPLEIKIPEETEPGTVIPISVEFKTITSGKAGMVSMGTGMNIGFDVIVTEEVVKLSPLQKIPWTILGIIAAIIVIIIILIIIIKRRKRKESG